MITPYLDIYRNRNNITGDELPNGSLNPSFQGFLSGNFAYPNPEFPVALSNEFAITADGNIDLLFLKGNELITDVLFKYKIDNGDWSEPTSELKIELTEEGTHTIYIISRDPETLIWTEFRDASFFELTLDFDYVPEDSKDLATIEWYNNNATPSALETLGEVLILDSNEYASPEVTEAIIEIGSNIIENTINDYVITINSNQTF